MLGLLQQDYIKRSSTYSRMEKCSSVHLLDRVAARGLVARLSSHFSMLPQVGNGLLRPKPGADVSQLFTWEEIGLRSGQKNSKQEKWLVINRKVYDITEFHWRHPGGTRVISHYAGQDATVGFSNRVSSRAVGKE